MISSASNPRIQRVRRLTKRLHRERRGRVLVEGARSVLAALSAGAVDEVFVTPRADHDLIAACAAAGVESREVSAAVMASLSSTASVPAALAIARMPVAALPSPATGLLLLDVRDPAQVGALIALGAATGAACVVIGPGTADPFGPRAIRAAGGGHWSCRVVPVDDDPITAIRSSGATPVLLAASGSASNVDLPDDLCLVVTGSDHPAARGLERSIALPKGPVEPPLSLRAAAVMYEWVRRPKDRTL